ncbi:MAG: hypothetical protein E7364_04510 [Clostridiales bacterium]|nr:hypothetical protein [Clostridiales bacterium]
MFTYNYEDLSRIARSEIGQKYIQQLKAEYERDYQGKPIYVLDYSLFKRFYIDGNRGAFQRQYFERRRRLVLLQALALTDDSYLEDFENILSAICDEFIWIIPAHAFEDDVVAKYHYIDLFSAETAFYLSETVYVFGDKLSKDIRNKIKISVKMKIVDIFETGTYFFEEIHNNWAAVCSCGVGLSYLYLFPERFPAVKDKIFSCMEHYLQGIGEEGYCEEGISYWEYGFGFFSIFFDVYTQLTGDRPDILSSPTVLNALKYPARAYMSDGVYLPYADGGRTEFAASPEITYSVKNLFGDAFDLIPMRLGSNHGKALIFRALHGNNKFGDYQEKEAVAGTVYYKDHEVFLRREKNYSFTTKCGHNDEMHNHNDVGVFQIVKNGKRLIVDIGAGEYTKGYFSDLEERYGDEIFVCGSKSHSVPLMNGKCQNYGAAYRGKVLSQSEREIEMDIAGAYEENGQGMLVKYVTEENKVFVCYRNLQNQPVCYRFVSEYKPKITDDGVVIEDMKILSSNGLTATLSEREYRTHGNAATPTANVYVIDYAVEATSEEIEFVFSFEE